MTNLTNLQRDCLHVDIDKAPLGLGASLAIGSSVSMRANDTVHENFAAQYGFDAAVTNVAGNWAAVGVFMTKPKVAATPYRVKGYVFGGILKQAWIVVGTAPVTPITGSNTLTTVQGIPIYDGYFDDIILLQIPVSDNAIGIGVAVGENAGGAAQGYISVQKLSVAPPTMARGVS